MSRRADICRGAALAAFVALAWCVIHDRLSLRNWRVPLYAKSDALTVMVGEKSAVEGYYLPFLPKLNPHFGAPFTGDWNDFPSTDEAFALFGGLLAKGIGLFAASNAVVLIGHLLAALSFYVVCRVLQYRWEWSWAGGVAFGLSHYAFQRGLHHVTLTYYWLIPPCLLVAWWCGRRSGLEISSPRFVVALGVALLTGLHNPYYTYIFLQFLGFAAVAQLMMRNGWRRIAAPLILCAASLGVVLALQVDTIYYLAAHGKNPEAVQRLYRGLELYALKPLDMFMPAPGHRLDRANALVRAYRLDEARKPLYPGGEPFAQYIGLAGIGALLSLGAASVWRTIGPVPAPPPSEALGVAWVILYSVIGGINGLLGQAGFTLFRCTNRYCIVILALALLFAVRALSRLSASWPIGLRTVALLVAVPVICWDQLPPRDTAASVARIESQLTSDRAFTQAMEKALPASAMVFQLPVMSFPESRPIEKMTDYDHFRPYLFSSNLRYSYGAIKGRGRDVWQNAASQLPLPEMVATLERYGFAAIYVNRNGYADGGAGLLSGLREAGPGEVIESPAGDLFCVLLHPASRPQLPPVASER